MLKHRKMRKFKLKLLNKGIKLNIEKAKLVSEEEEKTKPDYETEITHISDGIHIGSNLNYFSV